MKLHDFLFLILITLFPVYKADAQSLLWKISGQDLPAPSYLYGTIHLICAEDLKISEALQKAVDETEQLVLELDMDAPDFLQKTQTLSLNPKGSDLCRKMNKDIRKRINDFFQKYYGLSFAQISTLKPLVWQAMILQQMVECEGAPASYEKILMQIVQKQNKQVLGLEEVEEQFALFDEIPREAQWDWCNEYIKNFEESKNEMKLLTDWYKKEDLEAIYRLTKDEPQIKDFGEKLLKNRNKKWIKKIKKYARNKPAVFAVGVAHLPGKTGLIRLLKKAGYTLTPVKQ